MDLTKRNCKTCNVEMNSRALNCKKCESRKRYKELFGDKEYRNKFKVDKRKPKTNSDDMYWKYGPLV